MRPNRFRVALSFPGEHRAFVEQVAEILGQKLGRDAVFYDRWYQAELARPNLDVYLTSIYHAQSDLIAVFLCRAYEGKEWCGLEWRALRDLIKQRRDSDIMPFRFDSSEIPGLFSIDGYISAVDLSPYEVAALILERLGAAAPPPRSILAPSVAEFSGAIADSGNWSIVNGRPFETDSVRTDRSGNIVVRLRSMNSEDEAAIRSLQAPPYQQAGLIDFAYQNDGVLVRPQAIEYESVSGTTIFSVSLKPENLEYGGGVFTDISTNGYSGEEIAKLRGSRILLNDPPPPPNGLVPRTKEDHNRIHLEGLIAGIMTPLRVRHCPIQRLRSKFRGSPKSYLQIARLSAIFALKAGFVVEHVLRLELGPLTKDRVHVRFQGRRRKIYTNVEATVIEIEGDCNLEESANGE
jgi:hypothetical protein